MTGDPMMILNDQDRAHLNALEEKIKSNLHCLSDLVKNLNEVDLGFGGYCREK